MIADRGEPAPPEYVYAFDAAREVGPDVLGGKGAGLARMTAAGLPVPPGFTVTTRTAREFRNNGTLSGEVQTLVGEHLRRLEEQIGRRLGSATSPLLVSVRSGAPVSMPGMMDTVLNVGLNQTTVEALAAETQDPGFAWSCFHRFVESYARIVRNVPVGDIEDCLLDLDDPDDDQACVRALLTLITEHSGRPIPHDADEQIRETIEAVFRSWDSPRAQSYREFRGIDHDLGTAATVQAMVFGNRGELSASGVAFTRDPSSGQRTLFGDILFRAQGEDVVSGEKDALPLSALAERLPEVAASLESGLAAIENHARDLCEVEFTIEEGSLWILQTRIGQRSGRAAVRVATELVDEGSLTVAEAIDRVTPAQIVAATRPAFATEPPAASVLGRGLAASPGAVNGRAVFDASRAVELSAAGQDVVLIRPTTSPNDVAGFIAAGAVVTGRGGRTSHAAVVARGMHRTAVCGIGDVVVSRDRRSAVVCGIELVEGDEVAVDGDRGTLHRGYHDLGPAREDGPVRMLLTWCADAARVPLVSLDSLEAHELVQDLESLEGAGSVVLALTEPGRVSAADLTGALESRTGPPPVLQVSDAWLASADSVLRGRVGSIVALGTSPAVALVRASLDLGE